MKRMAKITLGLVILFLLGTMTGCGKSETSEKKYVGEYICEKAWIYDGSKNFLKIKKDRTYELKAGILPPSAVPHGLQAPNPIIYDGEWEIKENKIMLYAGRSRNVLIEGEMVGNELVDRRSGAVFVRQNIRVGKKSESQETDIEKTERVSRKTAKKAKNELAEMNIEYSETAFLKCVEEGNTTTVNLFLAAGMNPNAKNEDNETVLVLAIAGHGHTEIVHALLAKGVEVNAKSLGGWTALEVAANDGYTEIVQALLANGAEVNTKDNEGRTALMRAAGWGYTEIVQALLANGTEVNAKSIGGRTALMFAARNGRTEIVNLLRNAGAKE